MAEIKKEAVPVPSVGADGEQLQMTSTSTPMIPTTPEKVNQGNDCHLTLEEMYREMQRIPCDFFLGGLDTYLHRSCQILHNPYDCG